MADIVIKRGDTSPVIQVKLAPVITLDGATVTFTMQTVKSKKTKVLKAPCTIVDADQAIVQYKWVDGDTTVAGEYNGEFEVKLADNSIETFPNTGFISISITDDLA